MKRYSRARWRLEVVGAPPPPPPPPRVGVMSGLAFVDNSIPSPLIATPTATKTQAGRFNQPRSVPGQTLVGPGQAARSTQFPTRRLTSPRRAASAHAHVR